MHTESPMLPTSCQGPPDIDNADRARTIGSFERDLASGKYSLHWKSMHEMESWKLAEEEKYNVEFITTKEKHATAPQIWSTKHIYVCSRNLSGGKSHYARKHDRDRAIPSKKTGCTCRLTIKTYPNTKDVLGMYTAAHSHAVGDGNSRFTRLRKEVRQEIERLLRLGVEPRKVVSLFVPHLSIIHHNNLYLFLAGIYTRQYLHRGESIKFARRRIAAQSILYTRRCPADREID